MKIKLKHEFIYGTSSVNSIKYFNDLSKEEKLLLIDFFKDILNSVPLYGKNKSSAKLPKIKNHDTLRNFATFLNNEFFHYHLGKDFTLNPKLSYRYFSTASLIPQEITMLNDEEGSGKFKTCDNLVNYQMIDDEIIVYNLTRHNAWTDLVCHLCEQDIPLDYTTCDLCLAVVNDNNINCLCFKSTHTTSVGVTAKAAFGGYCNAFIMNDSKNEKIITDNFVPYSHKEDIVISNIKELNYLFKYI